MPSEGVERAQTWCRLDHGAERPTLAEKGDDGEGDVVVRFPGGDLRVRLANGRAWLYGSAERVS